MPVDDVLGWLRAYAVVGSASVVTRIAGTASLVRGSEVQAERGQGSEACTGVVRAPEIIRKWVRAGGSRCRMRTLCSTSRYSWVTDVLT